MHNSLIAIHDSSPYNALYGRQPAMLPPLEGGYIREEDHDGRVRRIDATGMHDLDAKYQRHLSRVREIAAATIIEVTALSRLQRADRHKTVAALERSGYQVGGLVDIWYEPTTKDVSGWKGPAQIATINNDEGNVTVRFQGRTMDRRSQEVRHHIPYFVYYSGMFNHHAEAFDRLADYTEHLPTNEFKTLGLIYTRLLSLFTSNDVASRRERETDSAQQG